MALQLVTGTGLLAYAIGFFGLIGPRGTRTSVELDIPATADRRLVND
jgi:hypothetical protein